MTKVYDYFYCSKIDEGHIDVKYKNNLKKSKQARDKYQTLIKRELQIWMY